MDQPVLERSTSMPEDLSVDAPATMSEARPSRRHDVDWLRAIALALLIVYHCSLWFISAKDTSNLPVYIVNDAPLDALLPLLSFLNVWRIPLLFLVSGVGMRFAIRARTWKQLLADRFLRLVVPLVFGYFVIVPITALIVIKYVGGAPRYLPSALHLWFLANLAAYTAVLLPIAQWLRRHPHNFFERLLRPTLQRPALLLLLAVPLVLETLIVKPRLFVLYVGTAHGFWLGLCCFFIGFLLASSGDSFWDSVGRVRWIALALALPLYLIRLATSPSFVEAGLPWLAAAECMSWILTMLGFGTTCLNRPSRGLTYIRKAILPIYIIHFPVMTAIVYFLLPAPRAPILEWSVLVAGTFSICLVAYELIIRRVKWTRPLFGIPLNEAGRF